MTDEYLNYIILLENTVASFYEKLKNISDFERITSILEFMETHSFEHAERIEEFKNKNPKPALDEYLLLQYQNNLTKKVSIKIQDEHAMDKVLMVLADSEEKLGYLYKNIVDVLLQLSEHYKTVAKEIEKIALEEFDHRDLLLKDRERILKK